jgi:hypothetical protein
MVAYRGVNDSGGELGNRSSVYDTGYHFSGLTSLQYLYSRGHRTVRLPFLWERIQPTLGAALNATELGRLNTYITNAASAGLNVVLDVHNYGGYDSGSGTKKIGEAGGPTQAQFADLWARLSTAFKTNATVTGYGLMNEPNGLPDAPLDQTNRVSTTYTSWVSDDGNPTITPNVTFLTFNTIRGVRNGNNYNGISSPLFNVNPGEQLTAAADVYPANRAGRQRLRLEYRDSTGAVMGTSTVFSANPTIPVTTWTTNRFTTIVPTGAAQVKLTVYLDDQTTAGDTWYIKGMYVAVNPTLWHRAANAAIASIRANADTKKIMVSGDSWGGVADWFTINGNADFVVDSANNFFYEAHHYWDNDHSGSYANTYSTENTTATSNGWTAGSFSDALTNRVMTELAVWNTWLTDIGKQGFIGEMGWPRNNGTHTGDYTQWNALGNMWYQAADAYNLGATYWAAGEWWGTYSLSLYDTITGGAMGTPNTQAPTVEAHFGTNGAITTFADPTYARVRITIGGATSSEVSIWRIDPDSNELIAVRNGDPLTTVSGGGEVYDYEAPLNRAVRYQLNDGTVTTISDPVTLNVTQAWLKAPGFPAMNQIIKLRAMPSLNRARPKGVHNVLNRKNPIVSYGKLGGRTGSMTLLTGNEAATDAMLAFLELTGVAYLQIPYSRFSEFYIALGDVDEGPLSRLQTEDSVDWQIEITEIDRPDGGLEGNPTSTYDSLRDGTIANYTALKSGYLTYLAVMRGSGVPVTPPNPGSF